MRPVIDFALAPRYGPCRKRQRCATEDGGISRVAGCVGAFVGLPGLGNQLTPGMPRPSPSCLLCKMWIPAQRTSRPPDSSLGGNALDPAVMSDTCSHNQRSWVPAPAVCFSIWFHAVLVIAVVAVPTLWCWLLGALVFNHLLLTGFGMWPKSTLLGPNLSRLSEACHRRAFVALTFDDGPDPEVTPRILDLLDQHDAKASFFCVGKRAEAFPHIVKEIIRRGHSVENHSDSHSLGFAFYSVGALRREIRRGQAKLSQTSGTNPQFFRAPVGLRSPLLDPVVAEVPLCYVSWTRRGYDRVSRSPQKVLRRLTRGLAAGDILLLHDTGASRTALGTPVVLDVLPRLLELLEASGLRAVSLPLALAEPPTPWARS